MRHRNSSRNFNQRFSGKLKNTNERIDSILEEPVPKNVNQKKKQTNKKPTVPVIEVMEKDRSEKGFWWKYYRSFYFVKFFWQICSDRKKKNPPQNGSFNKLPKILLRSIVRDRQANKGQWQTKDRSTGEKYSSRKLRFSVFSACQPPQ